MLQAPTTDSARESLCREQGYKFIRDGTRDGMLTSPKGRRIKCESWNNVPIVVPGLNIATPGAASDDIHLFGDDPDEDDKGDFAT